MKNIIKEKNKWLLRFDRGDELISLLENFCRKEKFVSGWFWGLGACQKVVLSYYDLRKKKYLDKAFMKDLEIASLVGNVGYLDDKMIIHAHGVFTDKNMKSSGGHIKKLEISGTGEVFIRKLSGKILRKYDAQTGLNTMKD